MATVKFDVRDVRDKHIHDPRVLVRFVNLGSGHVVTFDAAVAGSTLTVEAALSPGAVYRVKISPSLFSPALRTLMAVDEKLSVDASWTAASTTSTSATS